MFTHKIISFFFFFCAFGVYAQNADIYIMTGNAKEELGDLQGAMADYTLAIEDDSTYAMAYFNRAYVKRKLQDYEGAIEDYTLAIKFKPNYQIAYHNRGIVYMLLENKEEACSNWDKAWEMGYPDSKTLLDEYCSEKEKAE